MIRGRTLVVGGETVGPRDLVWLRFDPTASVRYYETLRALCHIDARIVNHPAAVLTVHDKRSALDLCPPIQAHLVGAAMAILRERGIFLAGLDFLGDHLTEINISCPGAIPEVNLFCGIQVEDEIIADLARTSCG